MGEVECGGDEDGWGRCYMEIKGSAYSLAGDESSGSHENEAVKQCA